jgi:hypothetical protein
MDCRTARLLLEFIGNRASEMEPDERESLEDHLADCPECRLFAESERRIEERIGRAMRAVEIPEGLRDRLLDRLNAERWRRVRRRALSAAAGVMLAASVVAGAIFWRSRPVHPVAVDLETAWNEAYQQTGSRPEQVQDWFREKYHLETIAPSGFNYNSLKFYDLASFQDKRVPVLLFIRDGANARVYILPATDFDFNTVVEAPGYNIVLLRNPMDDRFAYVAMYSSERLDWFLDKGSEPQLGMKVSAFGGEGGQ